ncbi:hypothetical protein [Leptothoe kymatousa]|uniref:Uncharacterized protein n=1 Tax=Leptothoe kymatousa TAU-MAC 1615 TaxID=2364775 RepID=A0ABS5XZ17_9CYAN|nr:hypothetical protein [Leptothoe kymatousa]MBT9310836.1 hypothetical protein [Leptothoe kymatousa TAU-MAC 1615]
MVAELIKDMHLVQQKTANFCGRFLSKRLSLLALSTILISACGSTRNKIQINTVDLPEGLDKIETLDIVTLTSSAKPNKKGHVKLDKLINTTSDEGDTKDQNGMVLVASKMNDQIQLLDFFVPQVNEEPNLSYESTARSLVMINPILLGVTPDKRISIFERVSENPKFEELVNLVSNSGDLLEDKVIQLSTEIAAEYVRNSQDSASDSGSNIAVQTSEAQEIQAKFNFNLPSKSCGDALPKDSAQYPVNFYPVYTKYTEANLKEVKKSFCGDAYSKKREGKDGQYIQVSSFTQQKKAEAFAKILQDRFGLGEIGEPTTVEEPRSGLLEEYIRRGTRIIFGEVARAESVKLFFDYKILENASTGFNYENDSPILNRLWRDRLELITSPGKLNLDGGVRIAEQVIVLPKNFVDKDNSWKNSQNWEDIKDLPVGNKLILPNDSKNYYWWGSSPVSIDFDQTLLDQSGNYEVLMSALSSYKGDNIGSALTYNAILINLEILNALGNTIGVLDSFNSNSNSNGESDNRKVVETLLEYVPLISEISKNLQNCIYESSGNTPILNCLLKGENSALLANTLGEMYIDALKEVYAEEVITDFMGDFVLKAIPYIRAAQAVNDVASAVNSSSRVLEFAAYEISEKELRKEPYRATIKVVEDQLLSSLNKKTKVEGFKNWKISCNQKDVFDDLEFLGCAADWTSFTIGTRIRDTRAFAKFKNYSSDWYEILSTIPGGGIRLELAGPGKTVSISTKDENFKVKRHQTPTISRTLRITCDEPNFIFWGIYIEPKCTSSGSYFELSAESFSSSVKHPTVVTCCGGDSQLFKPTGWGATGSMNITSSGKSIRIDLTVSKN